MTADEPPILRGTPPFNSVDYLAPALLGPPEIDYAGLRQRLVRGAVALPRSAGRVFYTVWLSDAVTVLSAATIAILLVSILLALLGCGTPEQTFNSPASTSATLAESPQPSPGTPLLRIAILQDKTGSSQDTRTPVLSSEQLQRLAGLCERDGCEITFGLIRDESNHLFERLTIEQPPVKPVRQTATGTNAIDVDAAQGELDEAYAKNHSTYVAALARWKETTRKHEELFVRNVAQLLAQAPDARHTDVNGGVGRADLFLAEDDATLGRPTHRYLLVISDCIDNIRKPTPQLTSGATVIVVNGEGSVGSLSQFNPRRFESIDPALSFIAAKEASTTSQEPLRKE